jgi:hypothetical protein
MFFDNLNPAERLDGLDEPDLEPLAITDRVKRT